LLFKYKGIDKNGKSVSSKVESLNLEDAKSKLRNMDIHYMSIKEDKSLFHFSGNFSFKRASKITTKDLSAISRDLSIYIKSGISIVFAIKLIKEQYKTNKKLKLFFNTISIFLDEGKNFYQALDSQNVIELPVFYLQSIKVSESNGILDKVLLELATFLKEEERLKKQISNAFAYPVFMITVSILMVGFMLSFVVPRITSVFTQMGQELPPITEFTINMANFLSSYWIVILASLITFAVIVSFFYSKNRAFKVAIDYILLKIPFVGGLIQTNELARLSYMISILTNSGVSFVESINLGSKIMSNGVLQDVFADASQKVVEGKKLSTILYNASYKIDSQFIQSIALGEETSQVTTILNNLADLYKENAKDKVALFLSLLEPMLMLFVGGTIGFIVVSMLLPIFSLNIG
jgi:general secretion pathway protein F/type IV pilus assembly protein PilC